MVCEAQGDTHRPTRAVCCARPSSASRQPGGGSRRRSTGGWTAMTRPYACASHLPTRRLAEDVGAVRDESFTDQGKAAAGASETVVVPVTVFERDEARAADAFNNSNET